MTLRETFSYMYYDLLSNQLEVCLVPSTTHRVRNGCCSRAVVSKNPKWYQDFCRTYEYDARKKKMKTIIKRANTLRALKALSEGRASKHKYIDHLTEIAEGIQQELSLSSEEVAFFAEYGTFPEPFKDQF